MPIMFNDIPASCINYAAVTYHLPATLILSVLKIENGRNGMARRNRNGSYDYGPMQINSRWLPELKRHGITEHDLRFNPCINVAVGSWILAQAITEGHHFQQGVGNYNSHTATLNQRYAHQVLRWYRLFETKKDTTKAAS